MKFMVAYYPKSTPQLRYVEGVELCGCETSNPADYEKMCGKDSPVSWVNFMPQNQEVRYVNTAETVVVIGGVLVAALTVLLVSSAL